MANCKRKIPDNTIGYITPYFKNNQTVYEKVLLYNDDGTNINVIRPLYKIDTRYLKQSLLGTNIYYKSLVKKRPKLLD